MSKKHLTLVPRGLPKKTELQGKIGWTDPSDPWIFWFYHENEERFLNLRDLMFHARRKAIQKMKPEWADDFSHWCVVISLERIERGSTQYAHLNDVGWLWNQYNDQLFATKKRRGPKWERATKTVSYDALEFENHGHFLDFTPDNNTFNPEEALLVKEALNERATEVQEALRDKRKEKRAKRIEKQDKLYEFLMEKSNLLGVAFYCEKDLAKEYGLIPSKFRDIIKQLEKRKKLFFDAGKYYLPDLIHLSIFIDILKGKKKAA